MSSPSAATPLDECLLVVGDDVSAKRVGVDANDVTRPRGAAWLRTSRASPSEYGARALARDLRRHGPARRHRLEGYVERLGELPWLRWRIVPATVSSVAVRGREHERGRDPEMTLCQRNTGRAARAVRQECPGDCAQRGDDRAPRDVVSPSTCAGRRTLIVGSSCVVGGPGSMRFRIEEWRRRPSWVRA